MHEQNPILSLENIRFFFGEKQILNDVSIGFPRNQVTALIGPSGCGKTTLIRCINRMHEQTPGTVLTGKMRLYRKDLAKLNTIFVRRKIGMVFQRPNPFPNMSIYENVLAGYILNGQKMSKSEKDLLVEDSLIKAALWDEVKDSLHRKGTFLSGGQQQRLCVARALAMKPRILLLDEPTSSLDPKATAKIEELLMDLKKNVTIILVTHNIAQASRVSDYTAFLYMGELVEFGPTAQLFTVPKDRRTEEYLTGKFG